MCCIASTTTLLTTRLCHAAFFCALRFVRAIEVYTGVSLGITIVGNTFANPPGFSAPLLNSKTSFIGALLSDGANTAEEDKRFTITNNNFIGLDLGINFLPQPGTPNNSLTGVDITLNSFTDFRAAIPQYIAVDNPALRDLAAPKNW